MKSRALTLDMAGIQRVRKFDLGLMGDDTRGWGHKEGVMAMKLQVFDGSFQ